MVRLITFIFIMVTGAFPGLFVYFGLALFLPVEPRTDGHSQNDAWDDSDGPRSYRNGKGDKEQDWDQRFYNRKK